MRIRKNLIRADMYETWYYIFMNSRPCFSGNNYRKIQTTLTPNLNMWFVNSYPSFISCARGAEVTLIIQTLVCQILSIHIFVWLCIGQRLVWGGNRTQTAFLFSEVAITFEIYFIIYHHLKLHCDVNSWSSQLKVGSFFKPTRHHCESGVHFTKYVVKVKRVSFPRTKGISAQNFD